MSSDKDKKKKKANICIYEDCTTRSSFNIEGSKTAKYCKDHKTEDMINVRSEKCIHDGCTKQPIYNIAGSKTALYCNEHKTEDMIDIKHITCSYEGCNTRPSYNIEGSKKALYCATHKTVDMIDIISKKCIFEDCTTRSSFNILGSKTALYCSEHKLENMIDVTHKKCIYEGCITLPHFNIEGSKTALYCNEHKLENMIDIKNKKCIYEGCTTRPIYNIEGSKTAKYCNEHKLENMINVISKKCIHEGCTTRPNYNFLGSKTALYCKNHKTEDMVNVISKKCIYEGCTTQPTFGKLFMEKTHCAKHKTLNEYKDNKPICDYTDCDNKLPCYSDTNYPKRCEEHKLETDTNVIETNCIKCGYSYYINTKSKMCNECDEFFIIGTIQHVKELRIKSVLDANNIKYESYDKIPEFACSKKRPDFIIDKSLFKIVLEVDENQHNSYTCECEQTRMIELHNDFGGTPTLFIRYNPDNYKDHEGKTQRVSNNKREAKLLEMLKGLDNRTEWNIPLSVYYLFYDGYNGIDKLEEIKY